tara:strand:- start:247 stop:1815 length:1569 start_codon:yes stop_codon:yes gene_type:complete
MEGNGKLTFDTDMIEVKPQVESGIKPITPDELKKIMRDSFKVKSKNKVLHLELLDHEILNLRPITLLDDKTRMILVYLPTRTSSIIGKGDDAEELIEFQNRAYMVCSGQEKKVMPIEDSYLQKNFRIRILQFWNENRWDKKRIFEWRDSQEKVNPKMAFELMLSTVKNYLDFESETDYVYFSLWNFHTYFYELFDSTPYNNYKGTKRAGKSKAMEFQKNVCFNPIMSADMTPATLFRTIEGIGATILLDEAENFKNKKDEKAQANRTLVMQGFLKDQYAVRNEGKTDGGFTPVQFNLYSPKSLASINNFDNVLEDRCIDHNMRRSKNKELLNKWMDKRKDSRFTEIRDCCYRLFLDHGREIDELQDEAGKLLSISGRELLMWKPIITLALFFEKNGVSGITGKIISKSSDSSESRQIQDEEESFDLRILQFVSDHGLKIDEKNNPEGWKPTKSLHTQLILNKEDYGVIEEYMTIHKFAEILKRLGFKRQKKESGISWLINEEIIKDTKERMGIVDKKQDTLD